MLVINFFSFQYIIQFEPLLYILLCIIFRGKYSVSMAGEYSSSRCHKNPYSNHAMGDASKLFIKDKETFILNDDLKARIRSTLRRLIEEIDKEYDKSDKFRDHDYSVYVGTSGQAMFYLHYYQLTDDSRYLSKAQKLIDRSLRHMKKRRFSFLNGDAGPLTIGALLYEYLNEEDKVDECVQKLKALAPLVTNLNSDIPDEILYGRAGYLYSLLFVNKHIKSKQIEASLIQEVVKSILISGQKLSAKIKSRIPLEYEWHGKNYYGAAHGIAGILFTLLKANTYLSEKEKETLIKPTLHALLEEMLPSGNLKSSKGSDRDRLVQWCHGSPGFISLLQLGYEVFKDEKYLTALLKSLNNVWSAGLLCKGYSLCHGVSGNAYSFLTAYQATQQDEHIYRALCFADWCTQYNQHENTTPDRPFSLYEGKVGVAFFLLDILYQPTKANFPGYEDI